MDDMNDIFKLIRADIERSRTYNDDVQEKEEVRPSKRTSRLDLDSFIIGEEEKKFISNVQGKKKKSVELNEPDFLDTEIGSDFDSKDYVSDIEQIDYVKLDKMPKDKQLRLLKKEYLVLLDRIKEISKDFSKVEKSFKEQSVEHHSMKKTIAQMQEFIRIIGSLIPDGAELKNRLESPTWTINDIEDEMISRLNFAITRAKNAEVYLEQETADLTNQIQGLKNKITKLENNNLEMAQEIDELKDQLENAVFPDETDDYEENYDDENYNDESNEEDYQDEYEYIEENNDDGNDEGYDQSDDDFDYLYKNEYGFEDDEDDELPPPTPIRSKQPQRNQPEQSSNQRNNNSNRNSQNERTNQNTNNHSKNRQNEQNEKGSQRNQNAKNERNNNRNEQNTQTPRNDRNNNRNEQNTQNTKNERNNNRNEQNNQTPRNDRNNNRNEQNSQQNTRNEQNNRSQNNNQNTRNERNQNNNQSQQKNERTNQNPKNDINNQNSNNRQNPRNDRNQNQRPVQDEKQNSKTNSNENSNNQRPQRNQSAKPEKQERPQRPNTSNEKNPVANRNSRKPQAEEEVNTNVIELDDTFDATKVTDVDPYIESLSEEAKYIINIIGEIGVSRNNELKTVLAEREDAKPLFYHGTKFQKNPMSDAVNDLIGAQILTAEQVKLGTQGGAFKMYELTDLGKQIYFSMSNEIPVKSEIKRLIKQHASAEHGFLIKDSGDIFREMGYTVYTERKDLSFDIGGGRRKDFDLIIEKDGQKSLIEVERGTHNEEDFFNAMDKIRQVTDEFYFICPSEDILFNKTKRQFFMWIQKHLGGMEFAKGIKANFTTFGKLRQGKKPIWDNIEL